MKSLKKFVSFLLTFAMCFTMMSMVAFANDEENVYYNFEEVKSVNYLVPGESYFFLSEKVDKDAVIKESELPEGSAVLQYLGDKNADRRQVAIALGEVGNTWQEELQNVTPMLEELIASPDIPKFITDICNAILNASTEEEFVVSFAPIVSMMLGEQVTFETYEDYVEFCISTSLASATAEGNVYDGFVKNIVYGYGFDDCAGGCIVYSDGTVTEYEGNVLLEEPGWYYACSGGGVSYGDAGPFYLYKVKTVSSEEEIPTEKKYDDVEKTPGEVKDITKDPAVAEGSILSAGLDNTADELKDKLNISDEDKAMGVNVWLELKDITESVDEETAAAIESMLEENGQVAMFLDLNLYKQVMGGYPEKIANTNGDVTISITVPENLRAAGRQFYIIYQHEGATKVVKPLSYDEATGILTFTSGEFSTYALAYNDTASDTPADTPAADNSPKTGALSYTMTIIAILAIAGFGLVYANKKRAR